MYCRTCGNKMNDNAAACAKCGAKRFAGSYYCQSCGAQTKQTQQKCQKCGAALKQNPTASQANNKAKSSKKNAGIILSVLGWLLIALMIYLILMMFASNYDGAGISACAIFGGTFIGLGKFLRKKK